MRIRCCTFLVRLLGTGVDLIIGCLCSSTLAKVHWSNTGTWWVKQRMVPLLTTTYQTSTRASTTPSNMIGPQTILAQILFSNELLSLGITFISELEALLKLMCSIAELAYGSTLNWILPFRTIDVSKILEISSNFRKSQDSAFSVSDSPRKSFQSFSDCLDPTNLPNSVFATNALFSINSVRSRNEGSRLISKSLPDSSSGKKNFNSDGSTFTSGKVYLPV